MSYRVILITGGSGKFGKKIIDHFLKNGDQVVFTSTSEEGVDTVKSNFYGEHLSGFVCDFTHPYTIRLLIENLNKEGLLPDALINNARSLSALKIEDNGMVNRDNFVNEYIIDVVAPYELTMALSGQNDSALRSVVNIGSQYGIVAANPKLYEKSEQQSPVHYGVAKAALIQLTKELAVRLATREIRVNCVAFGGVEGRVDEAFKKRYADLTPIRRMLKEEEIVGPIDFILSNNSSGMTGQVIQVDGGWSIW